MHSEAAERQLLEERPSPGDRARRAVGPLPADRPRRRRGDFGLRGAGPLAAPDPRRDLAREVRSARRGSRADRQDRRMGAPHRARRSRALARPRPGRGQPVAAPVQRSRASSTMVGKHLARDRRPRRAARARDHRGRVPRRGRYRPTTPSPSSRRSASASRSTISAPATRSLGYLKKAPFDKIKIDQSFVRGAAHQPTNRNAAIIRAIVTLAETLGMDTCAEGVETHDDLQLIRELGVSMVQGYIFGKPSPAEDGARARQQRRPSRPTASPCMREPRHRLMRRAITVDRRRDGRGQAAQHLVDGRARSNATLPVAPGDRAGDRHRRRRPGPRHRPLGAGGQVRRPVRPASSTSAASPRRKRSATL